jgi:hypothetical protein
MAVDSLNDMGDLVDQHICKHLAYVRMRILASSSLTIARPSPLFFQAVGTGNLKK